MGTTTSAKLRGATLKIDSDTIATIKGFINKGMDSSTNITLDFPEREPDALNFDCLVHEGVVEVEQ